MLADLSSQIVGLGLALGLGLLVGFEREWAANKPVGLRTFALIGVAGGLSALVGESLGAWIVGAGLLAVTALLAAAFLSGVNRQPERQQDGQPDGQPDGEAGSDSPGDVGSTTLIAAVTVYLIGAACVAGYQAHGVVIAGAITLLLHWKEPLHGAIARMGQAEVNAIVRFVLISLVILPVLPNRHYGPLNVFNPYEAWLLVVLIVALNLAGYVAFRLFSTNSGALLGGVLGGLVSSTATTVSFARLTRQTPALSTTTALIILLASAVAYLRVGVELSAVAPGLLRHAAAPMGVYALGLLATAGLLYPRVRRQSVDLPDQENPAKFKVALTFAALYVVIAFAVAAGRRYLGDNALYPIAAVSGLTNIDALTLSVGQLFARGDVGADAAWRSIFLATLANLVFKIGAASVLGAPALRAYMLSIGLAALGGGIALLLLWP